MITAVDTNILLDVLVPGAPHAGESEATLTASLRAGAVIVCDAVYAELAARFPDHAVLDAFLSDTGMRREPAGAETLFQAGQAWAAYLRRRPARLACPRCGKEQAAITCHHCRSPVRLRQHLLADFLIGAHAAVHADRLLTRDRGYYGTYFPSLVLA